MADVGVLALQGDFAAHGAALARCGARPREVRVPDDLSGCAALVIPGGESTTLLKLLEPDGLFEAIPEFHAAGGSILGTCAGAILLARRVLPEQRSLGLLDAVVERNAYGRQRQSFEGAALPADGGPPIPMLFIRAPALREPGPGVEILATFGGQPVLAREGRIWVCTGHPELGGDDRVHRNFLKTLAHGVADAAPQLRRAAGSGGRA